MLNGTSQFSYFLSTMKFLILILGAFSIKEIKSGGPSLTSSWWDPPSSSSMMLPSSHSPSSYSSYVPSRSVMPSPSGSYELPECCVPEFSGSLFAPNGTYIKTICLVHYVYSHENAQIQCEIFEMALLTLPDPVTYNALINHVSMAINEDEYFNSYWDSYFHVDGKRNDEDGIFYDVNGEPLTSAATWIGSQDSECLAIEIEEDEAGATSVHCDSKWWGWCELYT